MKTKILAHFGVLLTFAHLASDLAAAPFRMVVLGDSVLWGQGLRPENKIHVRVRDMLQDCLGHGPIEITNLAHSGAIIGVDDTRVFRSLHGEIPTSHPTILQQCDGFGDSPGTVNLVLLDGGANDIGGMRILHPFVPAGVISADVEAHCHQNMGILLARASEKFPNATIVVSGYYQIISDETPLASLAGLLTGAGLIVGGFWMPVSGSTIGGGVAAIVNGGIKNTIVAKCRLFADEANAKLLAAVNEANVANQSLGRRVRIVFADPRFGPQNAMLASRTRLYALNLDLSPQDAVASDRIAECDALNIPFPGDLLCQRASMYHPNLSGAQAYADAIFAAYLNPVGLVWVAFNPSCPTCGDGTQGNPFGSLAGGRDGVPDGGTILIRSGSSAETITINKSCRLQACGGPVTIGR